MLFFAAKTAYRNGALWYINLYGSASTRSRIVPLDNGYEAQVWATSVPDRARDVNEVMRAGGTLRTHREAP